MIFLYLQILSATEIEMIGYQTIYRNIFDILDNENDE